MNISVGAMWEISGRNVGGTWELQNKKSNIKFAIKN